MNGLAIMTGGMVSPPWTAMQRCLAAKKQKPRGHATPEKVVKARVQISDCPVAYPGPKTPVVSKPRLRISKKTKVTT